jgi:hypothetical protein
MELYILFVRKLAEILQLCDVQTVQIAGTNDNQLVRQQLDRQLVPRFRNVVKPTKFPFVFGRSSTTFFTFGDHFAEQQKFSGEQQAQRSVHHFESPFN